MKVFILFILFFSVGFSQAIEKFSEDFNTYFLKKSKEQVENLHKNAKLSLRASTNDRLNQNNLLTTRNSRLSDTVSDMILSPRQIIVLNTMEDAANDLVATNQNFNCANIALHALSQRINMDITECINLNNALQNFFNAGAFSLSIPQGSQLQLRAADVRFDNLNDSSFLIKNIERSIQKNIELEKQMEFLPVAFLNDICDDLVNNSSTFLNKTNLANKIDSVLGGINNCQNYNFNTISSNIVYTNPPNLQQNLVQDLQNMINFAQNELAILNTNLQNATNSHADALNHSCSQTPTIPVCRNWQNSVDILFNNVVSIQNEIIDLQGQINDLNTQLAIAQPPQG